MMCTFPTTRLGSASYRKLASTYSTFLSKVINQATKSAQGADGPLLLTMHDSHATAEHAVAAGSVALVCIEKIRDNLKYKPLTLERSVHAFIVKAAAAKQVRQV